ncbi:hypothetical protein Q6D67_04775 [Haliea sp. E1-2-M8]|uniref:hypothetical protein n=1 Tax=Haliea sp. E1-2-M8 TaxID=3064706 RepID=UPI0027278081|nr:hypothetical protein [Haliea sp. E1-2-M8]MDO8861009.1 hypothetical protein [Haliea sp. E1-2-M8]
MMEPQQQVQAAKQAQLQIFTSQDGREQLEVALDHGTVWLSQAQKAELFGKDVRTVNEHIGNVFVEGELGREATIRKFRIVREEGKRQLCPFTHPAVDED